MNQSTNNAFDKLLEYEKRSRRFAPDAQGAGAPTDEWSGITFNLGGARLTCNISRVGEILSCPQSTPVPGSKDWIIGLANVRGELLTVIDLAWFLNGERSPITARSRLLASSLNKAPVGLLIDEVFGQRRFLNSDAEPAELAGDSPLRGLVTGRHQLGSEVWHELDLDRLFNSAEFLNGSAH
jgi:twitching motility protein PilI